MFTVTNGRLLHVSGKVEGALTTEQVHTNYHLSLEYKWGEKTWPPFENKARNSGVLLHAHGLDYGFLEAFMPSIKVAIHEGHTGDLVMYSGEVQKVSLAAEGQVVRKFFQYKAGEPISTFSTGVVQGLNSTLDAKNEKGFRGPKELERPHGEWNQLECICKHDQIEVKLNGKTVNVAQKVTPARGRISLQSHGAEIFFRNLTLRQLD